MRVVCLGPLDNCAEGLESFRELMRTFLWLVKVIPSPLTTDLWGYPSLFSTNIMFLNITHRPVFI
jgi:hypothetical protein